MDADLYVIKIYVNHEAYDFAEADEHADIIAELVTDAGYEVESVDVEESLPSA